MSENYRKKVIDGKVFEFDITDVGDCDFEINITLKDKKMDSVILICTTYCVDIGDAKDNNIKPSYLADDYSLDGYYAFDAIEHEELYQIITEDEPPFYGTLLMYIQDLYVEPAFRRQGNATVFINNLAKLVKEFYNMDIMYLAATVEADEERPGYSKDLNNIMKHFLLKAGFWKKKNDYMIIYLKENNEE